jgi:phage I-like protein
MNFVALCICTSLLLASPALARTTRTLADRKRDPNEQLQNVMEKLHQQDQLVKQLQQQVVELTAKLESQDYDTCIKENDRLLKQITLYHSERMDEVGEQAVIEAKEARIQRLQRIVAQNGHQSITLSHVAWGICVVAMCLFAWLFWSRSKQQKGA